MSFFTSLSGMKNAQTDLAVISHNIANAETTGFKKSNAAFADLVATGGSTDPRLTPGIGSRVQAITQDFSLGALTQTGRGLDVAISGDGFLATANPTTGDLTFTRNGALEVVASGALQDPSGDLVQGFPVDATGTPTSAVPGNITLPLTNGAGSALTNVSINQQGLVSGSFADGTSQPVAQIALAAFPATGGLRAIGETKYEASADSGAAIYGNPGEGNYGAIRTGTLERSNVDLADEMVSLLTAQRNFQANARALDTATSISQVVLNLQS
ncbi:flagellar hook basal-body protein [Erythrobacter sp. SCSIO 43205]|uniref:flagellar hook-basal body protein n=1 Tax=Erythrobacter sp. SCSIO 43205 TaxID=2779361 RepID=UPI001CA95CD4|nr:flagellar hook basal-body protein [Erythrobacter sp. SCSIO 43205]UAB78724.1 flagellar hook basal-body protein [Erythrobacter sp. SCSIO 43205]